LHARGGDEGAFARNSRRYILAVVGEDAGGELLCVLKQPAATLYLADPQFYAGLINGRREERKRRAPGQAEDETGQDEPLAPGEDLPELEQADLVVGVGLGGLLGVLHVFELMRENPDYRTVVPLG